MAGRLLRPILAVGLSATLLACGAAQAAPPSTFGTVIGNALLCLDQIDNAYFYTYLSTSFGPAYKREGGAYWFRTRDATLWGTDITEVIVSDDSNPLVFVGAVAEVTPEKLDQAIQTASGLHYRRADASAYPVRQSNPGSTIVYFNTKSKVYCSKYKPPPPGAP